MLCAVRLGWTKEQTNAQDPDFIEDLRTYFRAEADHDRLQTARRKRNANRSKGEIVTEDAELDDVD